MACECVRCADCNGQGTLWETPDGEIHLIRCDDMGELVTCESCRGSGIGETCMECEDAMRDEDYR
jgi:hypothetical protein